MDTITLDVSYTLRVLYISECIAHDYHYVHYSVLSATIKCAGWCTMLIVKQYYSVILSTVSHIHIIGYRSC